MNLEEKILAYKRLDEQIKALEEQKKRLSQEIIPLIPKKKVDVPGYRAYCHSRLSISLPLEKARLFGATKMVEQVDKEKIKELYKQGQEIEGVKEISYLLVKAVAEPDLKDEDF